MEHRLISAEFVQDALDCVRRQGGDIAPILQTAGITDLAQPVSNLQYGRMWLAMAQALEDEFFGLGARAMRPGSFALMGHAVLHAGQMDRALRRALRFLNVALEHPSGQLRLRESMAEVVLADPAGPRPAFAYRAYWLILLGLMSWLVGRRIPLVRVDFACPAPPNRLDYRQFFGAPVHFDQPECRLIFAAHHLDLPTIRDDRDLKAFLRGAPANILVRYRHDQGLSGQIRSRLRAASPEDWPDFNQLAGALGQSPATLRRRLRAEGQGFVTIRSEMRHALACRLLHDSDDSIAQVAAQMGYAEPGAFHRAFLKIAGITPASFRAKR